MVETEITPDTYLAEIQALRQKVLSLESADQEHRLAQPRDSADACHRERSGQIGRGTPLGDSCGRRPHPGQADCDCLG